MRIPIRADHGRSFFNPSVVAFDVAGKEHRCPLPYGETLSTTTRLAAEAGVNIVTFGASNGWIEPEKAADWGALDAVYRRLVAAPLFAPILEEGDEVWAVWRDLPEKPALVVRKHANGTGYDIFLGPGQLFRELLHVAAKTAGVHCYLDCAAGNVIAAEGHVAVQNVTDKPLTVVLRDGSRRTLDIPKGATRILRDQL